MLLHHTAAGAGPGGKATHSLFFIFLGLGILAVVSGLFVTRLHWRSGIPPYGVRTPKLEVMLHPERFTDGPAGVPRLLNMAGLLLLLAATCLAVYEVVQTVAAL